MPAIMQTPDINGGIASNAKPKWKVSINKSLWLKALPPPALRAPMLQLLRELGTIHEQNNHCIRGRRGSGQLRQTS
ncbi:hypothetical protein [Rhizobium ruizarguesonis]|uniref:hypothetical protein n=1 Tax=Rhizobium ruizarguesonis TaxID=2081791 RepID=UPI0013D76EC5|nr:hypothetical protein [Rhizobium ruizarguesonis]MBY5833483.1 hypothetical protein [Rhizobium leguminosarum]MBY5875996.1 hypothetical protein [Rhizobium leguminosarum]